MYSLKNVQIETGEYSAVLHAKLLRDGREVATVYNPGYGGSHDINFYHAHEEANFALHVRNSNHDADRLIDELAGLIEV